MPPAMKITPIFVVAGLLTAACVPVVSAPVSRGPIYPGFDAWRYPGDDLMTGWRRSSPYRWVGYYLPAPCHRADTFTGKRQFLTAAGWGIAVIYVGQQVFEGETPAEITESTVCSSALLTADRGTADGNDAVARTRAEGFPPGSVVFLDIERVERIPPELITYYHAWLRAVLADGTYRPGTYAHSSNASGLYTVAQRVLQEVGISESIPFWIAGGEGFTLDSSPEDAGYRFTHIWQGVLDTSRTWGGRTLVVDENVARNPSPSAPESR
jgi:hypothetical protein